MSSENKENTPFEPNEAKIADNIVDQATQINSSYGQADIEMEETKSQMMIDTMCETSGKIHYAENKKVAYEGEQRTSKMTFEYQKF